MKETYYRTFEFDAVRADRKAKTVEASIASTTPVDRIWGKEILSLEGANLERMPFPLLVAHNSDDLPIGSVRDVRIVGNKLRGLLQFGQSNRAAEIWSEIEGGVIRNLSIGYRVNEIVQEGKDTYKVLAWDLLEVSLVAIPADTSVGINRSNPVLTKGMFKMESELENEKSRVKEFLAIGEHHKCHDLARKHIESGTPLEEFRTIVLEEVYRKKLHAIQTPDPEIGLTDREAREFSICRGILALSQNNRSLAPFEFEVSDAMAKRLRKPSQGFFVPHDVLKRDLTKGSFAGGGATVSTELLAGSFIDMLRNASLVRLLGATVLPGLVGDIAIPRQTGGATAYWVGENGAPTESQQTFGQVAMTPKTVGAFTDISRKLLIQSTPSAEELVRRDLALLLGTELDRVCIEGQGAAGEPLGIINTTGIGSVAGGTNGAAPTWAHIVNLESTVANLNAAVGNLGYLTNSLVRGKLKQTFVNATYGENPIWMPGQDGFGSLNGYKAGATKNVPSDLTKGTASGICSAIIFGNWADLIIGEWGGGIDVLVDPYTGGTAGTVRVRVLQDIDIVLRHVESFAAMLDALTT